MTKDKVKMNNDYSMDINNDSEMTENNMIIEDEDQQVKIQRQ